MSLLPHAINETVPPRVIKPSQIRQYVNIFRMYLFLNYNRILERINLLELGPLIDEFVELYNKGKLDKNFYTIDANWTTNRQRNRFSSEWSKELDDLCRKGFYSEIVNNVENTTYMNNRQDQGPTIPTQLDLSELELQQRIDQTQSRREDHKRQRRVELDRLEEIAPKSMAGTRERMLEIRAEKRSKISGFQNKDNGDDIEVSENVLMGNAREEDSLKAMLNRQKQRRDDAALKKAQYERELHAVKSARLKAALRREQDTMEMLRELATQRFPPKQ